MSADRNSLQDVDFSEEKPFFKGVCFDPDSVTLEGWYSDELAAHRAKRSWVATLGEHFLLDEEEDFICQVNQNNERRYFYLRCEFITACARYAFWRLTNSQAPEAQYLIETAHIPDAESHYSELLSAPDMRPISEGPLILSGLGKELQLNEGWFSRLKKILQRMTDEQE